jgi:hypothetical protein
VGNECKIRKEEGRRREEKRSKGEMTREGKE